MSTPRLEPQPDGSILLWIKAVPGASRDQVAGVLGDRLKIRVAAPPEGGKANQAICQTLARALKVQARQVEVHSGHSNPEKTARTSGITPAQLANFIEEFKE